MNNPIFVADAWRHHCQQLFLTGLGIFDQEGGSRVVMIGGILILLSALILIYFSISSRKSKRNKAGKSRSSGSRKQPVQSGKTVKKQQPSKAQQAPYSQKKPAAERKIREKQVPQVPAEQPQVKFAPMEAPEFQVRKCTFDTNEFRAPVISIRNVTMVFHVATENVSGLKEYLIQKLKRQISYRDFKALDDVSFNVYKGEVVGIIGTNGSGKSTLLRIVSGALKPTSGKVLVNRRKLQLLTLGTGFDMELTAKENVYLNGSIIGYSRKFIDEHYDEIVEFAELQGFMEEKVKNFSSGMVSRLGFAIATVGGAAEILILDEVLSVGDEFFRQKSLAKIKEMIHSGATVLMVSHGMNTIVENCTKAVWIEKGVLQMIGDPQEVCKAYREMNRE